MPMANCFGLAVQACYATPRIDGAELMRRQAAGEPLVVVDSRPFEEFHAATVPGAVNLPVAELFHRIAGPSARRRDHRSSSIAAARPAASWAASP